MKKEKELPVLLVIGGEEEEDWYTLCDEYKDKFRAEHKEKAIRIPMSESVRLRSFNLSNSANIILFEALRQLSFPGLK